MEPKRKNFQGVLNILSFNRHYYVFGFIVLGALVFSRLFIGWHEIVFWVVVAAFLYGLIMPLIVSAYVYDFSGYYNFNWLNKIDNTDQSPKLLVNINAGFDETSFIIKNRFSLAQLKVFDFYNPKRHTEQAIKRARKVSLVYPGTQQISSDFIPMEDQSTDIVFLLSAAHEIRSNEEKALFLRECHRICKPGGKVIMVEHLRDFPNFLAFSIGFTHFFSRSAWKKAIRLAGFSSFHEDKFTPFMSVFKCKR